MKNTYLNLEVPLHVSSEPVKPKKTTDLEYHPAYMGPIKVFPTGKNSSIELFAHME